jgi:iron-sulfur cluster assembly accessory protein
LIMLPQLTITAAAEKFIRRVLRFSGLGAGCGLRLAVSPGGCSGLSSEFSAQAAAGSDEHTLEVNGLRLFIGAESRLLLDGITMDFCETATQSGFAFIDPHKEACACSTADAGSSGGVTRIEISAIGRGRPAAPVVSP